MANFKAILSRKMDDIEAPKPVPVGIWNFRIPELYQLQELGKNNSEAAVFQCIPYEAVEVDEEAIAEYGGLDAIKQRKLKHTLWLTEDALFMAKRFCTEHCEVGQDAETLLQALNETKGASFAGVVTHYTNRAGDPVAQIDSTMPTGGYPDIDEDVDEDDDE